MVKLKGTAGNDVLGGLASDDRIAGLAGNDTLIGAAGFDTVDYGASSAAVNVNFLTGKAQDGYGNIDTISGFEEVNGSRYSDVINLGNGIFESAFGHAGNDKLYGNGGEDWLRPGSGSDVVDGGAGQDTISYFAYTGVPDIPQAHGAFVSLNTNYSLDCWGYRDTIINVENIEDSVLDDTLIGNSQENDFTIRGGNNYIDGGAGIDEVIYRKLTVSVNVNLTNDTAGRSDGGHDILHNIEDVRGSAGNDTIVGDSGNNKLEGEGGDDALNGGSGKNILLGDDGDDRLYSGSNADYIDGGQGIDTVYYNYSVVGIVINLSSGKAKAGLDSDTVINVEQVFGSNNADSITGDYHANGLYGLGGNDWINALGGNDFIDGGSGVDTACYSGVESDYSFAQSNGNLVVRDVNLFDGNSGTDTLHDVEQIWIGGTIYKVSDLIF